MASLGMDISSISMDASVGHMNYLTETKACKELQRDEHQSNEAPESPFEEAKVFCYDKIVIQCLLVQVSSYERTVGLFNIFWV